MNATEKEALLATRKGHIEDAKAVLKLSEEANGGVATSEALAEFDKYMDAADVIHKQIEADEKATAQRNIANIRLKAAEESLRAGIGRQSRSVDPIPNRHDTTKSTVENGLMIPMNNGRNFDIAAADPSARRRATAEYQEAFGNYLVGGHPSAAMTMDTASEGGVLVPTTFVADMIKELNAMFPFRQLATVIPQSGTQTREVEYPRRTTRLSKLIKGQVWSSGGTDPALGTMKLTLHPWTGEAQINKSLIQFSPFNVEQFLMGEINYDKQVTQEQMFMTGAGTAEPFGLFTEAALGLSSTYTVTKALTWDGMVDFMRDLRDVYLRQSSTRVITHRNFQKALMKIRTTDGVPLFQPSLVPGVPDTLLGVPLMFSEFAPAGTAGVYGSGTFPAVVGDLKQYYIFESMNLAIEQHDLDIRSNLNSYLYRLWFDGNVRMPEAFRRLKVS